MKIKKALPFIAAGVGILIVVKMKSKKKMALPKDTAHSVSTRNIATLHPLVRDKAIQFINEAKKVGLDLIVVSGFRTYDEQTKLYNKGRTTPGAKVTNAKAGFSNHNFGLAFDIAPVIGGKLNYNIDWSKLSTIAKKIGLAWGGDWKSFPDKPHFELKTNLNLAQMRKLKEQGKTKNGYIELTA